MGKTIDNRKTKKCPYCCEEILIEARKCRYCGEWLQNDKGEKSTQVIRNVHGSSNYLSSNSDKRILEFVLGLIGGILGISEAFFQIFFGGLGESFEVVGFGSVTNLGFAAIVFSAWGIVGAVMVRSNGKCGGWVMTTAAIGGFISSSIFYIIPGVLLLIPGLMGIRKKIQDNKQFKMGKWLGINAIVLILVFIWASSDFNSNIVNKSIETEEELFYIGDTVESGKLLYKVDGVY